MANSKFVLEFDVETQKLQAKVDAMIAKFQRLGGALKGIGDAQGMRDLYRNQKQFEKGMRGTINAMAQYKAQLTELDRARKEYIKTGKTKVGGGAGGAGSLVASLAGRGAGPGFTPIGGTGAGKGRGLGEVNAAIKEANRGLNAMRSSFNSLDKDQMEVARHFASRIPGYDKMLRSTIQRADVEGRVQQMLSQKPVLSAVNARRDAATEHLALLKDQQAEIRQGLENQMPAKMARQVADSAKAREVEATALKAAEGSLSKMNALGAKIAARDSAAAAKFTAGMKAGDLGVMQQALDNARVFGRSGVSKEAARAAKEMENYAKAVRTAARARKQAEKGEQQAEFYRKGAGGVPALAELQKAIARTRAVAAKAIGDDAASRMFPGLDKDMLALRDLQDQSEALRNTMTKHQQTLSKSGANTKKFANAQKDLATATAEYNRLIGKQERLVGKMGRQLGADPKAGLPAAQTPEQMKAAMMSHMTPLARTFTNIFSDMSRRFIMTLQFAISSAILFGTMRIVKEFLQTAIEVERAFADIESAMEFDIESPRGTAEFDLQVEKTRQAVLRLANDYNVLPTEANKAAFVMISRFKDIDNALMATRAQLLATKVSTIDQSETLRALTAVAEGFAAAELDMNESMNLNERLLKREATSAKLYMKALDLAVHVQQKYGVEVEDTLEGTARATQVFRQMGFTMEETAAIVAGTSRELGQTGQQAAERLVRSLGQLTDPKIRDALLDLAAGSKEFSLSITDFSSGADAWKTITKQFQSLEKSSPNVAREILQIVGQRRELEAVAAALGTTDLQQDIVSSAGDAAGAAENRFTFLNRTVSEMLKSIAAGFQELSQNFERLGGVQSLKIIVGGFDLIIKAINNVLRLLIDFKEYLNGLLTLGSKGLGTWITQFAALGFAITGVVKVTQALSVAFASLTGTAMFKRLAGLSLFGGATAMSASISGGGIAPSFAAGSAGLVSGPASAGVGTYVAGATIAYAAKLKAFTIGLAKAIPVWGWVIGGAALAASSMKSAAVAAEELTEAFNSGTQNVHEAMYDARQYIREEGLTGADADLVMQKALFEARTAERGVAPSGSPALQEYLGKFLVDLYHIGQTAVSRDPQYMAGGSELAQISWNKLNTELVPGSTEYWKRLAEEAEKAFLTTQRQVLRDQVDAIDWSQFSVADLTPDERRELGVKGGGSYDLARVVTDIQDAAAGAQDSGDLPLARELTAEAEDKMNQILAVFGMLPKQLSESVKNLTNEFDALETDFQLGKLTRAGVGKRQIEISGLYRDIAEAGKDIFNDETYKELIRTADDALVQGMASQLQAMNDNMAAGARGGEGDIERLKREILTMRTSGNLRLAGQAGIEARLQFRDLLRDLAIAEMALAVTIAEQNVQEADTWVEYQRAQAAKSAAVDAAIEQAERFGDQASADAMKSGQIVDENAEKRKQFDINKSIAVARQRESGSIMNSINNLKAQIVGINMDLAGGYLNPGEIASLVVQKNELIAQIAQAEQAEIRAYAESQISVRDAMKANQLELTMLARELSLTAKLFGRGSVEWSNVKKAMNNMKAALMDQALELEDIQRRLTSDLTDPYVQASLDLVDALQKQKVPDMGLLEQARADLAVKEAQMADLAAFFDDRLFTLKFDLDTGAITESQYVSGLKKLLAEVDTTTRAGKELWQEINGLIEGMTDDLSDMQFNIPGQIRLPTLFEVRRSLTADSLGVNYQDNRQQDIRIYVNSDVDVAKVANAVNEGLGAQAATASARYAPGSSTLTLGV